MKTLLKELSVMLVLSVVAATVNAQYVAPKESGLVKNLVKDYNVKTTGKQDITDKLQEAINNISRKGGGNLIIPKGTYTVSHVDLKSNVHIGIEAGTTIYPSLEEGKKTKSIFSIGEKDYVENVSICGLKGRFKFIIDKPGFRFSVFSFKNVNNFLLSDVDIDDVKTQFPLLLFTPNEESDKKIFGPTNGTVKNATAINCHYGYGLVQAHCAKNVYFENLDGVGGVTLRLETGAKKMNDRQFGGVFNITAKKIACTDGNAAVMISPHSMQNGTFKIEDVTAKSCGFAVRCEGGFVSKKYSAQGIKAGTFADGSYIKNVTATFGMNAQIKPKHFQYMPKELLNDIKPTINKVSENSPSIAAVVKTPNYNVDIENVKAIGFKNEAIVTKPAAR